MSHDIEKFRELVEELSRYKPMLGGFLLILRAMPLLNNRNNKGGVITCLLFDKRT